MEHSEILEINREGWDKAALLFSGVTALPVYGPFTHTEEELQLFGDIKGRKVLEIGCGDGYSLAYMSAHGAGELWGIDLSPVQIERAEKHLESQGIKAKLFSAPMEADIGLPKEYFDIVYSIYALGWTTSLTVSLSQIFGYLKPGGSFIFSWEHPIYSCLSAKDGMLAVEKSYCEEGCFTTDKWRGMTPIVMHRRKISTYINELINAGFNIERLVEGNLPAEYENVDKGFTEKWYSAYKASMMPTTMIIKAVKRG